MIDQDDLIISILKKWQDLKISPWIGNDEAELELSLDSRSFVNRLNDQVRKRTNFQRCRRWRRTFYYLVNVYVCNNGISGIHG